MICLNPKCGAVLTEYQWGEGYCSKGCMAACLDRGERISDMLHGPCGRVVAETADEVDAMLEAMEVDRRLPRIIYLLRGKMTKVAAASECHMPESTLRHILCSCDGKLLRRCGLRTV